MRQRADMSGFWLQTKFYQIYLQKSQVFFNKNHNFRPKRTTVWESLQTGGAWTANEIRSKLLLETHAFCCKNNIFSCCLMRSKPSFSLKKTTETCFDHNSSKTTIRYILQKTFTVAQSLESELLIWNASHTITNTFSKFETAAPETATRPRER